MKLFAISIGLISGLCLVAGLRLLVATYRFANSDEYSIGTFSGITYSIRTLDPDRSAIYGPSLLMILLGVFLGRFAFNLWGGDLLSKRNSCGQRNDKKR